MGTKSREARSNKLRRPEDVIFHNRRNAISLIIVGKTNILKANKYDQKINKIEESLLKMKETLKGYEDQGKKAEKVIKFQKNAILELKSDMHRFKGRRNAHNRAANVLLITGQNLFYEESTIEVQSKQNVEAFAKTISKMEQLKENKQTVS